MRTIGQAALWAGTIAYAAAMSALTLLAVTVLVLDTLSAVGLI